MIKESRLKYILYLTLLLCLLTVGIILSRESLLLNNASLLVALSSANAFFFIYEVLSIIITEKKRQTANSKQLVNTFLALKVGRILLSLMFATVYALAIKVELKRFILLFVLVYFVYLLFDTLYLAKREKKLKKNA